MMRSPRLHQMLSPSTKIYIQNKSSVQHWFKKDEWLVSSRVEKVRKLQNCWAWQSSRKAWPLNLIQIPISHNLPTFPSRKAILVCINQWLRLRHPTQSYQQPSRTLSSWVKRLCKSQVKASKIPMSSMKSKTEVEEERVSHKKWNESRAFLWPIAFAKNREKMTSKRVSLIFSLSLIKWASQSSRGKWGAKCATMKSSHNHRSSTKILVTVAAKGITW